MKHSATGMTPKQAMKKDNEFKAMVNVASKAKKEKSIQNYLWVIKLRLGGRKQLQRKRGQTIF